MTANVWNPGAGAIPVAQSAQSLMSQAFTAVDNQVLFNLTTYNYTPGTSSLIVAINGVMQIPGVDFTETSSSSFTVSTPLVAGDIVLAFGFVGVTATTASVTALKDLAKGYSDAASQSAINSANSAGAASVSEGNALAYKNTAGVSASQVTGAFQGMRNRIINGDMRVNQRGLNSVVGSAGNLYLVDRWRVEGNLSANFGTASDGTVALASLTHIYILNPNAAKTVFAAGEFQMMSQAIEGINLIDLKWGTASAKPVTISFRSSASVANTTISVAIRNNALNRSYVVPVTITGTNTPNNYSITIPGCTDGVWATDNTIGLILSFCVVGPSNGTYGLPAAQFTAWKTANYIYTSDTTSNIFDTVNRFVAIADVQLEVGTSATAFQQRPYAQELALCHRYYYKAVSESYGIAVTNSYGGGRTTFPVPMRAQPTVTNLTLTGGNVGTVAGTTFSLSSTSLYAYNTNNNWTAGFGITINFEASSEL